MVMLSMGTMTMKSAQTKTESARHESKTRLLNAALRVIRAKGYSATRVEDICETAGVTKGSFFHHFDSKEELALAAADYWTEVTSVLFASAPYHQPADPLERLLAYVDFRKALLRGELPDFTCLVGTMTQEIYDTHPAIRDACERSISGHAATLVPDIEAAMEKYNIEAEWTAESLALHTQVVLQGAFILAKAKSGAAVAGESVDHLRRYLELLFRTPEGKKSGGDLMNLTQEPEVVDFPVTHYVFVEKIGPFMQNAGQAWQTAHTFVPELSKRNQITGYMSLYKMGPKVYRAGFGLSGPPVDLPEGLGYEKFEGGKYARFVLTGPYSQLPAASGQVWTVAENKLAVRDDFAIENYMNDPRVTPEDQLITQILVPVA